MKREPLKINHRGTEVTENARETLCGSVVKILLKNPENVKIQA